MALRGVPFAMLHLDRTNPLSNQYHSLDLERPRCTELDDRYMDTADWQSKVIESCTNSASRHLAESVVGGLQGTLFDNGMRAYYVRTEYRQGRSITTHFRNKEGFTLDLIVYDIDVNH